MPQASVDQIESAFGFLAARGFVSVATDVGVRFDSPHGVFVHVFYVEREQFLGLRVGLASSPRDALTSTEMLVLDGAEDGAAGLYPATPNELAKALDDLAALLDRHGQRALAGERAIFDEARELRRAHTERFTRQLDDGA